MIGVITAGYTFDIFDYPELAKNEFQGNKQNALSKYNFTESNIV